MSTRKPRILLVEDDEAALFGYEKYLNNTGFETLSSPSLEKARERLRADRVDAILLDLRLPDGNAMDWIPEIKSGRPELPVIVLTGISDVTTAVKAIKNGFTEGIALSVDGLLSEGSGENLFVVRDGVLVDGDTGVPFTFEIVLRQASDERIALAYADSLSRLGVRASVRTVDSAQYTERMHTYDFDMTINFWNVTLSPGAEQDYYWEYSETWKYIYE